MSRTKKAKIFLEAAVVTAVALALLMPGSAVVANTDSNGEPIAVISPLNIPISSKSLAVGNVLISGDNPDEPDENPKIVADGAGNIVVVYEKTLDVFTVASDIVFSDDQGSTWYLMYELDSTDWEEGSGELRSNDLAYNPVIDKIFWDVVDPTGGMYNLRMTWMEGDMTNAGDILIMGVSGQGATDHYEAACTWAHEWALTPYICDEPDYNLYKCPGLGYWDYDFEHPAKMGGFYYDGGMILDTTPSSNIEADNGGERMYMVMQVDDKIGFKATSTDPTLLDSSGGGPGGMDRYADIEVWPWQNWIVESGAEDPDVSGDGNKVCIVFAQDGMVKCAYSHDVVKDLEVDIEFQISTIDEGGYPSVYMVGDTVFVGYVKNGNLYVAKSIDGGITWGTPEKKNDVDGTVVGQFGSVHIGSVGIVWTDSRNGEYDVYYEQTEFIPTPNIEIESISGGIGATAKIVNTGEAEGTFDWSLNIEGTVFFGGSASGTATLAPGESIDVKSGFALGLGKVTVKATADTATKNVGGTLLLFFLSL